MDVPDFVRIVALFEATASLILSGLSLWLFVQRHPPKAVLHHVIRVSITYYAFVGFGLAEILLHFGYGFRWELFAEMGIFALAANSHIPLVKYEWHLVKASWTAEEETD